MWEHSSSFINEGLLTRVRWLSSHYARLHKRSWDPNSTHTAKLLLRFYIWDDSLCRNKYLKWKILVLLNVTKVHGNPRNFLYNLTVNFRHFGGRKAHGSAFYRLSTPVQNFKIQNATKSETFGMSAWCPKKKITEHKILLHTQKHLKIIFRFCVEVYEKHSWILCLDLEPSLKKTHYVYANALKSGKKWNLKHFLSQSFWIRVVQVTLTNLSIVCKPKPLCWDDIFILTLLLCGIAC